MSGLSSSRVVQRELEGSDRPRGAQTRPALARGLYAIVDVASLATRGLDPLRFTRAVAAAGPVALQIRAKEVEARELLLLLREAGSICRAAGIPIVANDRVDLAVLAGCAYVHVGQTDLPVDRVRRVAPGLLVGVSTHGLEQLERALASQPDYVAYGPVFPTTSKADPDPCVGLDGLRTAAARAREAGIPLVAIGGVTQGCAAEVGALPPLPTLRFL